MLVSVDIPELKMIGGRSTTKNVLASNAMSCTRVRQLHCDRVANANGPSEVSYRLGDRTRPETADDACDCAECDHSRCFRDILRVPVVRDLVAHEHCEQQQHEHERKVRREHGFVRCAARARFEVILVRELGHCDGKCGELRQ